MKRWPHQEEAFQFLKERAYGALFMDMGTGKSKVIIDVLEHRQAQQVLILAPKTVCAVWPVQLATHGTGWDIVNLTEEKSKAAAYAEPRASKTIYICNYESFWREPLKTALLKNPPDTIVCDESHRIKSAGSKASRFAHLLGKRVRNRYLLTGTPFHNSLLDIYGQFRFMNPEVFGTNYSNFMGTYAVVDTRMGFPRVVRFQNTDQLKRIVAKHSFHVSAKDVLTLPDGVSSTVSYSLSKRSAEAYSDLRRDGIYQAEEGTLTISSAITLTGRLQQICSGYVPVYDDNMNMTLIEVDTSRAALVEELIDNIDVGEPIVVFCKFRKDIEQVLAAAKRLTRKTYEISGRISQYKEFKENPKGAVVVLQIQSGSAGIDLTEARYAIYYSHSHSLGDFEQSKARVLRPGQTRPVFYYQIVAKHPKIRTVDEVIINSLNNKKDAVEDIMEYLRS